MPPLGSRAERLDRFLGGPAGPDVELEGGEIAFTGIERQPDEGFALGLVGRRPARKQQAVTEHQRSFLLPPIGIAETALLVDEGDEAAHFRAPAPGTLTSKLRPYPGLQVLARVEAQSQRRPEPSTTMVTSSWSGDR